MEQNMNVSQALIERKSVRAFLNQPVALEDVRKILEFARKTPSGTNTQPWTVAVVSGETKRKLDAALVQAFREGAPKKLDYNYYPSSLPLAMKQRRLACGLQMYQTLGITRQDQDRRLLQWEQNYSAFGAPVVLYFFINKLVDKGSFMDCGMFLQSVMLMATELGLASCAQAALAEYPDIVREHLGYSDDNLVLCGLALGYEDTTALINSYRTAREEVDVFAKFFA
jgi:nitroreductase